MPNKYEIKIDENNTGKRIDQIIPEGLSRSQVIKYGTFTKDGQSFPGKTKTQIGESWQVEVDVPTLNHLEPWDFPLKILKDSKTWAVVQKPYGISVHPSSSEMSSKTLVHALMHHFGDNLAHHQDLIDGQTIPKLGLVHRLDKTTSGLILIAKTNESLTYFQEKWPTVEKIYTAVVHGTPPNKGRVEAYIDRDKRDRTKMAIFPDGTGKKALTTFEKIDTNKVKTYGHTSLLSVQLHTGRTHQIRVHLSSIGFPIVGDTLYGGQAASRVFLHATKLSFPDPDNNGKIVDVESEMPADFWE